MKKSMVKHYKILLLALFIGIISSVPQYITQRAMPNFQGLYVGVADDMDFYQARAQDVIDGHPFVTNPYFAEHKTGEPMQFWIPDYILAKPIQWLGLSTPLGFIIWTFFLTMLLTILSYSILLALTGSIEWSFLGTALLNVGFFGVQFLRLAPPGLTFVFWLAAFLALFLAIDKGGTKRAIVAAFFFGMLFNIYPFYWTYYVIVFGLFIAASFVLNVFFVKKEFIWKTYLAIFGGGLIVAIPFFIATWASLQLPYYTATAHRLGMIFTRFPSGFESVLICGITAIIFFFCYKKKQVDLVPQNIFLLSGVLGGIIAVNQAIITGQNVEFSSHYLLGNEFFSIFVLFYLFCIWLNKKGKDIQKKFLIGGYVIVFCTAIFGIHAIFAPQISYNAGGVQLQTYAPIFDWLKAHAQKDDVVYANDSLSDAIPIYTSQNVYYSPYGILFFMTDKEAEDRFIISHYFDDFTSAFVIQHERFIFGGYYVNTYGHDLSKNKVRKLFGLPQIPYALVPSSVVNNVISDAEIIQSQNFDSVLHRYQIDYMIWDTQADLQWHLDRPQYASFLTPVYSYSHFIIYQVK